MNMLLKVKLDVNSYGKAYGSRGDILLSAINFSKESDLVMNRMVHQLLDAGADPEAAAMGKTALLSAIDVKNLQVVKLLLGRGSDINRPARRGLKRTPPQQAC